MRPVMRTTYSDSDLISLMKLNDKAAFYHLFNNYSVALISCIKELISDDHTAEDLLQDVFVKIWIKIGCYDSKKSSLYTWMRRIAKNTSIDFLRCGVHNMRSRTDGYEGSIKSLSYCTEQKIDKIGLNQLIAKLSEKHKSVICLVYYSGCTFKEIADILDIPLGTVKTRTRNALASLRKEFV